MPSPTRWCARLPPSSANGPRTPAITRVVITRGGRAGVLGGRRHPRAVRSRQGRPARRGAAVLARRVHAQHADQALSEALRGADRRHRHGRRRRHLHPWLASGGRRPLPVRHARGRHRLLPRRRRDLVPAAPAGRARHLLRADRRAHEERRRGCRPVSPPTTSPRPGSPSSSTRSPERCRSMPCSALSPSGLAIGALSIYRAAIDRLFSGDRIEDIMAALDREAISGSPDAGFAGATVAAIRGKSPTSLKIARRAAARGPRMVVHGLHEGRIPHRLADHPRP